MLSATTVGSPSSISCKREAQVIVEVGRVEDDQERVRLPLPLLAAEQDVASDRFVGADRIEAVGAGQVDDFDRAAVGQRAAGRTSARP